MGNKWGSWGAALVVVLVLGAAPIAGAATDSEADGADQALCDEMLAGTSSGRLQVVTDPPAGAEVTPGQWVDVTLIWDQADFERVDRLADCISIDGRRHDPASVDFARADNIGAYHHRFAVPENAAAGTLICSQALLSGTAPGGVANAQRSQPACLVTGEPTAAMEEASEREATGQAHSRRRPDTSTTTTAPETSTTTTEPPTTTTTTEPTTTTTVAPVPEETPEELAQPAAVEYAQEPVPVPRRVAAGPASLPRTGSGVSLASLAGMAIAAGGIALIGAACHRRST